MKLSDGGCLIAFTVLTGAILPAFAAKLTDKEHTRIEEPRPADVPSDAALEAAGRSSARWNRHPQHLR